MIRRRAVAFGPGRINLIGEHTDHEGGLALPFAIERGVTVVAERRGGERMEVRAEDLGQEDAFGLADPERADGWRAFARGVVAELRRAGHAPPPARLTIGGDLPHGVGLSSSAALEAALCLALLALEGEEDEIERVDLARLCSRVEHGWVGAETGLLDQLASLLGRTGKALRIDFATLAIEPVELALGEWRLVALDAGAARDHASSGYNARRAECRAARAALGVGTLRDAARDDLPTLPEPLRSRARHVVEENARVDATVAALRAGDLRAVGRLLDASHESLRDLFAASHPAVERTRDALLAAGAAGARMVGGGFGGSVLALLGPGVASPTGAVPVAPSAGARLLE